MTSARVPIENGPAEPQREKIAPPIAWPPYSNTLLLM
jgi:hypothetical protein